MIFKKEKDREENTDDQRNRDREKKNTYGEKQKKEVNMKSGRIQGRKKSEKYRLCQ